MGRSDETSPVHRVELGGWEIEEIYVIPFHDHFHDRTIGYSLRRDQLLRGKLHPLLGHLRHGPVRGHPETDGQFLGGCEGTGNHGNVVTFYVLEK